MEIIESIASYLKENHEWLFSGIGTYVITGTVAVLFTGIAMRIYKKRSAGTQKIKSGKKSTNIQSGRDTHFKG